jgi:hypothetical protein
MLAQVDLALSQPILRERDTPQVAGRGVQLEAVLVVTDCMRGVRNWSSPVHVDRQQLQHVFTLQFLQRKEHVILVGPSGIAAHCSLFQ